MHGVAATDGRLLVARIAVDVDEIVASGRRAERSILRLANALGNHVVAAVPPVEASRSAVTMQQQSVRNRAFAAHGRCHGELAQFRRRYGHGLVADCVPDGRFRLVWVELLDFAARIDDRTGVLTPLWPWKPRTAGSL